MKSLSLKRVGSVLLVLAACLSFSPETAEAKVTCGGFDERGKWLGNCGNKPAKFVKKVQSCPNGSFFDPIDGGTCWSCPSGWNRQANHVKGRDACVKPATPVPARAKLIGGAGCKAYNSRAFEHWTTGECWSCPPGYGRSIHDIKGGWACASAGKPWAKATYHGRKGDCPRGSFFDPIDGGTCWACPPNFDRQLNHVKSADACARMEPPRYGKAKLVMTPGCGKGEFFDPIDGGTCWACPDQYKRAWNHVKAPDACYNDGIVWKTVMLPSKGLEQLDGAAELAKEILSSPDLLKRQIELIGKEKKVRNMDAFVKERMSAIAKDPLGSPEIQDMLYVIMYASSNANVPPPKIGKLIRSFEAYIKNYDVYLAQDALNAYDAWARADDHRKKLHAQEFGVSMMSLADYGTPPPDYTKAATDAIVAASGFSSLAGASAAMNALMPTITTTTRISVEGVKISKTVATAASHIASKSLAGATMVALPFSIIAGVAINQFVDIVTARPKLEDALRKAKQGVKLQTLMETEQGQQRAKAYWRLAIKGDPKHRRVDHQLVAFAQKALSDKPKQQASPQVPAVRKVQNGWVGVIGSAVEIAIKDDGTAFLVGDYPRPNGYDMYIQKRQQITMTGLDGNRQVKWERVPGEATRIAAGKTIWHINKQGGIWRMENNRWVKVQAPKAVDIAAGGGNVYMLGGPPIGGKDYAVHKFDGKTFQKITGAGQRIDVDKNGNPWVINHLNDIWVQINQAPMNGEWSKVSGKAKDISVSDTLGGAVVGMDDTIWLRDGKTGKWSRDGTPAKAVSIGPDGKVWAIEPGGGIVVQQ